VRPKNRSSDLTFIEATRRRQIVTAAIETIAELGYPRASFARIAKRAGLSSPGLISYHFANKDELIEQVVAQVYATGGELIRPLADDAATAADELASFVAGSIGFYTTHRTHMLALMQILNGHPSARERWFDQPNTAELAGITDVLTRGQRAGEFRDFPPHTVAVLIRDLLSGALLRLLGNPELDVAAYTDELVAMVRHAVANPERTPE
jgi:AcrR family transcriptional regulator